MPTSPGDSDPDRSFPRPPSENARSAARKILESQKSRWAEIGDILSSGDAARAEEWLNRDLPRSPKGDPILQDLKRLVIYPREAKIKEERRFHPTGPISLGTSIELAWCFQRAVGSGYAYEGPREFHDGLRMASCVRTLNDGAEVHAMLAFRVGEDEFLWYESVAHRD